jgi:serine phosphatase RsbU (regulator of sigma subunit)/FMN phosphatase YigB (HAD superfamily)
MKPKAIIFDLDDTLFDCTGTLVEPARRRAAQVLADASKRLPVEQAYNEMEEAYHANGPDFDAIGHVAELHKLPPRAARVARKAYQQDVVEEMSPFPDVAPTLGWLKNNGMLLFLVSKGNPARQQEKLAQLGIAYHFSDVRLVDERSGKSPDFSDILRRWRLFPEEVLSVGDRIRSEIKLANKLGMISVRMLHGRFSALKPSSPEEEPQFTIRSVGELRSLIAELMRESAGTFIGTRSLADEFELVRAVSEKVISSPDIDEVLKSIIEGSTELMRAERGSIMILDDEARELRIRAAKGISQSRINRVRIKMGQSISGYVAQKGIPVVIDDIETDSLFARRNREGYLSRSAICVPMKVKGKVIGVLNMSDRKGGDAFTEADLPLASLIANQAAIAIENARLFQHYLEAERIRRDLELAGDIQRDFLPDKPPETEGLDIAAINLPSQHIGGDYYDFFELPEGNLAVTIADVSGHGIGSALLMAALRTALHTHAYTTFDTAEVLHGLNSFLMEDKTNDSFVTMFMGVFSTKDRMFTYSNAGHDYPIWYIASENKFTRFESTSLPLGVFSDIDFPEGPPVQLAPGDVLALFTDGLVDTGIEGGTPFGRKRIIEAIRKNLDASAQEILDAIIAFAHTYCSVEACDDITLIVIKVKDT